VEGRFVLGSESKESTDSRVIVAVRSREGTRPSAMVVRDLPGLEARSCEGTRSSETAVSKPPVLEAVGGDTRDCLSGPECDFLCDSAATMPADTFFRFYRGELSALELRCMLQVRPGSSINFIVHVRHHWVATQLDHDAWRIFDSARSAPVCRDIADLANVLGLPPPTFVRCPQQRRATNECGLFASLYVLMLAAGVTIPDTNDFVSLAPLRDLCGDKVKFFVAGRDLMGALVAATGGNEDDVMVLSSGVPSQEDEGAPYPGCDITLENLNVWQKGKFICDHLLGHWLGLLAAQCAQAVSWYLIAPAALTMFAGRRDRRFLPLRAAAARNAAAIVYLRLRRHFVVFSYSGNILEIRDSLPPPEGKMDLDTRQLLDAFWEAVAPSATAAQPPVRYIDCQRQQECDCGLHAINNVIWLVSGLPGDLSRNQLKQAWLNKKHDRPFNFQLWQDAVPQEAASVILPSDPPAPKPEGQAPRDSCVKCNREVLEGDYCAWDHPGLPAQRRFCSGKNRRGKKCKESALEMCGVTTCVHHTPPEQLARVVSALQTHRRNAEPRAVSATVDAKAKPPALAKPDTPNKLAVRVEPVVSTYKHNPYEPISISEAVVPPVVSRLAKPSYLKHKRVSELLSASRKGQRWLLSIAHASGDVGTYYVVQDTTIASPTGTFDVLVTASRCSACDGWVKFELDEQWLLELPQKDDIIYQLREQQEPLGIVASCGCEDECGTDDDEEEDGDDKHNASVLAALKIPLPAFDELELALLGTHPRSGTVRVIDIRNIFLFPAGKPNHVSMLSWREMAPGTRQAHRCWIDRVRSLPNTLNEVDLAPACVNMVLKLARERSWQWSTVASALSMVASAFRNIELYSNATKAINLMESQVYISACRKAQQNGKVYKVTKPSETLPIATKNKARELLKGAPVADLLLELCWFFAARIGDLQQVRAADVEDGARGLTHITFRFGKGAKFWGPYTVAAKLPDNTCKALAARCAEAKPLAPLFFASHKRTVGAVLGALGHTSRAIRRGALCHLAGLGMPDDQLIIISGHRRMDTLHRYLGWGLHSSSSAKAAYDAANLLAGEASPRAGEPERVPREEPPKMGLHSGKKGLRGQRVASPPELFPHQAPKAAELGLVKPKKDSAAWPLHVKDVKTLNLARVRSVIGNTPALQRTAEWTESAMYFGLQPDVVFQSWEIPKASVTMLHMDALLAAGKVVKFFGIIRGYVMVFLVAEDKKERWRVICEPHINKFCMQDQQHELKYPGRWQRRVMQNEMHYTVDIDMAAYFDQFELHEDVRSYFVMKAPDGCLYALTRLPMGARFAPGVAQSLTWDLVAPLREMEGVAVITMIDNIRIAAASPSALLKAVRLLQSRLERAGVQLNDLDRPEGFILRGEENAPRKLRLENLSDEELLQYAVAPNKVFLGERYQALPCGKIAVCNTDSNLDKLSRAWERLLQFRRHQLAEDVTPRHLCSFVGLLLWLANTIDVNLYECQSLLRAYSGLAQWALVNGWDTPLEYLHPAFISTVEPLLQYVTRNEPVALPAAVTSPDAGQFDITVCVDACAVGWGAYVAVQGEVFVLQQRWSGHVSASAWTEPLAVARVFQWLRATFGGPRRVAVVTDHSALESKQRRWFSGNGGFSSAFFLNEAYRATYAEGWDTHFFFIDGSLNPADAPSRDPRATLQLTVRRADVVLPLTSSLSNSHRTELRKRYQT
jgi:hypothetical protein